MEIINYFAIIIFLATTPAFSEKDYPCTKYSCDSESAKCVSWGSGYYCDCLKGYFLRDGVSKERNQFSCIRPFCLSYMHSYESKCYFILKYVPENNFDDAGFACKLLFGERLASVSSLETLEFLTSLAVKHNFSTSFWVGLERVKGEHIWKDGTNAANQSWVAPELRTTEKCSLFDITTKSVIAEDCEAEHHYICEERKGMFDPIEQCKEGLTEHSFIGEVSGRCIYRLPITTTKERAEEACSDSGGSFMKVEEVIKEGLDTFKEHKVMAKEKLKYWTDVTWNGSDFVSDSRSIVQNPVPFKSGEGNCVTVTFNADDILKSHYTQTRCDDQAHIICSSKPPLFSTDSAVTVQQENLYCPEGQNWKSSSAKGACYLESTPDITRMSWEDAKSYCQSLGGDLASFHSAEEERNVLSDRYGCANHTYWIGLRLDLATETYKWSDGSPLDYQNWASNHPNHKDKSLQCVSMDKNSQWISSLCGMMSRFICKSPRRADPYVPITPTRSPLLKCEGFSSSTYHFHGYCYNIGNTRSTWQGAKVICEEIGFSLASIHSDAEVGFLLRMLYEKRYTVGNRVWIGLNSSSKDVVRWSDGSPVDFTFWDENDPNNHVNQEKCGYMYTDNGLWKNENCDNSLYFICKQKNAADVPETPTTIVRTLGNCKKEWFPYDDRCYLLRGADEKDRLNWTQASKYCTNQGGYITSIRSAEKQAYLTSAYLMQSLKSDTWIGFHDTIISGKYYWMDNSDVVYTNWASLYPFFFGKQHCGKMRYHALTSGVWENYMCSMKLPFICQMEKDPKLPLPHYNHSTHHQGWFRHDDLFFKMYGENTKTWEEAIAACRREDAKLISITGTEVMAVSNLLGTDVNQSFWIGLQNNEENKISWLNKWPVTLTKWGKNEPKSYDKKMCYASTSEGYWERVPCDHKLPYICQKTTGAAPPVKKYTGDCPSASKGWIPFGDSYCLLPVNTSKDWFWAALRCPLFSHLTSIHSLEDAKMLKAAFGHEVESVFLGLWKNEKGGFEWTDGSPVDYVNWDLGEELDSRKYDRCVKMVMETLKWRIVTCSLPLPYACQDERRSPFSLLFINNA